MTCARNMALWLVGAIVLIAVLAMPSGAQAHAGHAHPGPNPAVAALAHLPALATVSRSVAPAVAVRASGETVLACACDGACCRIPGTPCCSGAALAPDPQAAPPARRPGERALARALPARTDIVPEALPKPPRPFA